MIGNEVSSLFCIFCAFQLRMTTNNQNNFPQEMLKLYKHFDDPRPKSEIQLTNHLARALSQLNLQQLPIKPKHQSSHKALKKQDFLYVCINGFPPFQNQFQYLQLPGQRLQFFPSVFDKKLTQKQRVQSPMELDALATVLHIKINEVSKTKPIIMIYHSFGTYIFAQYCQMFKNDRIIGLIDIGGAPIRFYPIARTLMIDMKNVSIDQIRENIDIIFQGFTERNKKLGLRTYENKYQVLGVCRAFKSQPGFKEMFEYLRNLPKVLKCFIFGRKDSIFPEHFLNQKVVYYSYTNKFDVNYQQKLKKTYQKCFDKKCDNVQERFVYSLQGGYHSIHMQKKYKEVNAKIIDRYLNFIEELYAEDRAQL